ncbi:MULTISPECIES: hypothetical protein [Chitinophagaceae]
MKTLFLIFILLVLNTTTHAQAQDTIGLLKQTILNKKSNFLGKPFSTLVNALPASLPIKNYYPEPFSKMNRKTDFGFMSMDNLRRGAKNIIYVIIYWLNPASEDSEFAQWRKLPVGQWDQDDLDFYKNWIIKDIKLWVVGADGYEVK